MRRQLSILSFFFGMTFATVTFAEMSMPYGWYVEPNLGVTKIIDKNYSGSVSTSGLGYNLNLGYKFMPYFGAEFGYTRYAQANIKNNGSTVAKDSHYSYGILLRGIVPLTATGFEAFGKIGIARVSSSRSIQNSAGAAAAGVQSGSHNSTGFYIGVGMDYYYWSQVGIVFQWQRAQGNSASGTIDLWSLGVNYLFN